MAQTTYDFRLGGDTAVVMSDYHICRYDAILGVLVCVGDDSKVLVLGKDMCRELLPLRQGTHWLDCFLYAGTTTFLVLAPEMLLCMDYSTVGADSVLSGGVVGAALTCLHVPQGLVCGAVGRKDGKVSFFRLNPSVDTEAGGGGGGGAPVVGRPPQLQWATKEVDLLSLCAPFCKGLDISVDTSEASKTRFFSTGAVLAMDSYPENPNAFIAVVAGVPGVCKWYVDEARVSCFFDAMMVMHLPDGDLAACKVTPGGIYVAATTMHSTRVLLWNEGKSKKRQMAELYWMIDLSDVMTSGTLRTNDPFWYNEYRVGIAMARTALDDGVSANFRATNDKHSQMYLLVHGQRDIVEVVVRVEDRQVTRRETIIAGLNAFSVSDGEGKGGRAARGGSPASVAGGKDADRPMGADDAAVENYFNVFHVEPCVLSSYWNSAWADVDLEALIVTSAAGLRPIVVKRNRQAGGVESVTELRELSATAPWWPRALLLRLPSSQMHKLAQQLREEGGAARSMWERLLRGGDPLPRHCRDEKPAGRGEAGQKGGAEEGDRCVNQAGDARTRQLCRQLVMLTVTDAAKAVCASPQSNEVFAVRSSALRECAPWSALALGQDASAVVLERALPQLDVGFVTTELLLRVVATDTLVLVMKVDVRRNTGSLLFDLDRPALELPPLADVKVDEHSKNDNSPASERRMVRHASLVDASLAQSPVTGKVVVRSGGKALMLLLEDSTVALVDLGGAKDEAGGPARLLLPVGLLPMGTTVRTVEMFWLPPLAQAGRPLEGSLCVAYLFEEGRGVLLWNVSQMRMINYSRPAYSLAATRLRLIPAVTATALPNLTGDVVEFDILLTSTTLPSEEGEYGTVTLHDALGTWLFGVAFGLSVCDGAMGWCYRYTTATVAVVGDATLASAATTTRWHALTVAPDAQVLTLHVSLGLNSVEWSVQDGSQVTRPAAMQYAMQGSGGSVVEARAAWALGRARLMYDTADGEMRSYELNAAAPVTSRASARGADERSTPTLAFVSDREIALVDVSSLTDTGSAIPTTAASVASTAANMAASIMSAMALPTGGNDSVTRAEAAVTAREGAVVVRVDATRWVEHLSVYRNRGALLVVTRDVNGWRWVSVLDSHTATPRMEPYATLSFAGEERLQIVSVEVDSVLHLYFLGSDNGVIGHLYIESDVDVRGGRGGSGGSSSNSSIRPRHCFSSSLTPYRPVPSTFRGYGRFLPAPPTLKQETGFFKRLMTLPWEEVALKLESETLRQVRGGEVVTPTAVPAATVITRSTTVAMTAGNSAGATVRERAELLPSSSASPLRSQQGTSSDGNSAARLVATTGKSVLAAPAVHPPLVDRPATVASSGASVTDAPTGSRYAQLKAIAEREQVSLAEARRMMSENVRKLQQRGERLNEIQNKSAELAQSALTFQDLARQLKEKQRSSWL